MACGKRTFESSYRDLIRTEEECTTLSAFLECLQIQNPWSQNCHLSQNIFFSSIPSLSRSPSILLHTRQLDCCYRSNVDAKDLGLRRVFAYGSRLVSVERTCSQSWQDRSNDPLPSSYIWTLFLLSVSQVLGSNVTFDISILTRQK